MARASNVVYWMSVSLDGFVETRDGKIDWTAPDDDLHRFFNDDARRVGAFLYGRRSYELMAGFWPTADASASAPGPIAEFARIWRSKPKVVFSKTLRHVDHNAAWRARTSAPRSRGSRRMCRATSGSAARPSRGRW